MRLWSRHSIFFNRAKRMTEMPLQSRPHLVLAPADCGELELLASFVVPPKQIYVVGSAEDCLRWEEHYSQHRLIADDLRGVLKECQRRFLTARIDATGPLDNAFFERLRSVIAFGMTSPSVLTVTFRTGGETGIIKEKVDRQTTGLVRPADVKVEEGEFERQNKAASRTIAMQRLLEDRLAVFWEATFIEFFALPDGELEVTASGLVERRRQSTVRLVVDGLNVTASEVQLLEHAHTEASVRAKAQETALRLDRDAVRIKVPITVEGLIQATAAMFALPIEEVTPWITPLLK